MHCEQVQAQLDAYLEKALDEEVYQSIYSHLECCDACCRALEETKCVFDNLHGWNDVPVPSEFSLRPLGISPKRQLFVDRRGNSWAQWLPVMACSVMFILLILRVEIQITDDGTLISFSGISSQSTSHELNKRLDRFAWEQQQWMQLTGVQIMDRQRQNNESLIRTVMALNNKQNQQYYEQLMQYWQSHREQDLQTIGNSYRHMLHQQHRDRLLLTNMIDHISDKPMEPDNLLKRN